ncbi:MAG: cell division protein FtsL [Candidatus Latescibacterota bacterium]|nr:MAG: cell division protein FtsL [Candidatus Latescibacterota bacterium]
MRRSQRWGQSARRWVNEFDPWAPRPGDYVLASALFLLLALAYVGERSHDVQLTRRVIELEERRETLRNEVDLLLAEVTALADRRRVVAMARDELGMTLPEPDAIEYIYFVADDESGSGSVATESLP